MAEPLRESSLALVRQFIVTLERSAVDNRHSPALYARYLKRVLGDSTDPSVGDLGYSWGQPGSALAAGPKSARPSGRVAFSPGPSEPAPEEDVLAAMYSLTGDFWDNALLPGTWGISSATRGSSF